MIDERTDTVLVACPTYRGLEDCLDEYVEAYHALKWPRRELLLVDNTRDEGQYAAELTTRGLNVIHIEPTRSFQETFSLCWEEILRYAIEKEFHWVFSVEQDVICPPLALDTLLNVACYVNAPFVTHTYPYHWGVNNVYQGLGCTLIHRDLLKSAMEENRKGGLVEGSIYKLALTQNHVSLTNLLDVKHLDGRKRFWQYDHENDPRVMYPPEYTVLEDAARKSIIESVSASVTVAIPAYNVARFIPDTLRSVLAQSYPVTEILVCDDGSTDDLEEAIAGFDDRRIRVIRNGTNQGVCVATNRLIDEASGEFIVLLSADDTIEPNLVEEYLIEFYIHPEVEFVASQTDFMDESGQPFTDATHPFLTVERPTNRAREQWLSRLYHGNLYFGVGMYRAPALREIGGYDETYGVICDYELYLRLLQRKNIRVIERNLTHIRIREGQRSQLRTEDERDACNLAYQKARAVYYSGAQSRH